MEENNNFWFQIFVGVIVVLLIGSLAANYFIQTTKPQPLLLPAQHTGTLKTEDASASIARPTPVPQSIATSTPGHVFVVSGDMASQNIIELMNKDRADLGLPLLHENILLDNAADEKANDEADRGYFSHIDPDGNPVWPLLDQQGYNYSFAGENLSVDFKEAISEEKAWMLSPEHRKNIASKNYTDVGVGVEQGEFNGNPDSFFVVVIFASQ